MNKTFLDKDGLQKVAENVNLRLKIVLEMPATPELNMVRMYKGTDTANFKKGHIYQYNGTSWEDLSGGDVDLIYNPTSTNAQSGSAIDKAVKQFITDNTSLIWETKTWQGAPSNFYTSYIWKDGGNVYFSNGATHRVLDRSTDTWETKTWSGLSSFYGSGIWHDGDALYFSEGSTQYVFNRAEDKWERKTWNGLSRFSYATDMWTDGTDFYFSDGSRQYVLNRATSTWEPKTWNVNIAIAPDVWHNGDITYYSSGATEYVLNKMTMEWEPKTWYGLPDTFVGREIWTDGNSLYYEYSHVLNQVTDTWEPITWNINPARGSTWIDGENLYSSNNTQQYVAHRVINTNIR